MEYKASWASPTQLFRFSWTEFTFNIMAALTAQV